MNRFPFVLLPIASLVALTLGCSSSNSNGPGVDSGPGNDGSLGKDTSTGPGAEAGTDSSTSPDSASDAGSEAATLSFSSNVYSIVDGHCIFCHGPLGDGGPGIGIEFGHLNMATESLAYANLVGDSGAGVPAQGVACGALGTAGLLRVDPGNAAKSLFYNKLVSNDGDGGSTTLADGGKAVFCGNPMPEHEDALPTSDLTTIQNWINQGANP